MSISSHDLRYSGCIRPMGIEGCMAGLPEQARGFIPITAEVATRWRSVPDNSAGSRVCNPAHGDPNNIISHLVQWNKRFQTQRVCQEH